MTRTRTISIFLFSAILIMLVGCAQPTPPATAGNIATAENENILDIPKPLKVGAAIPLSGPGAFWGESLKKGFELAMEDLEANGIHIEVAYEDTQGDPKLGLAAYRKLVDEEGVDVVVTEYSRVAIPLIPIADQDRVPLIMTLIAAKDAASKSKYAFRFFTDTEGYVKPHFDKMTDVQSIAILHINDEYGTSVGAEIEANAAQRDIEVRFNEPFNSGEVEFRTQLTKIKDQDVDAILFVAALPQEQLNFLEQSKELGIESKLYAASSTLSLPTVRASAGETAEGAYVIMNVADFPDVGVELKQRYAEKYNDAFIYMTAFGYDIMNLLARATGGASGDGDTIVDAIHGIGVFEGINGDIPISDEGEINPPSDSAIIEDGELVLY